MRTTQINTRITLAALSVALIASAFIPKHAHALQGGEDPALLPVLVDKRFGNDGRHQLSLLFSTSMADKFIESLGGGLSYGYNFSDMLGVEFSGGYFNGEETNILTQIRTLTSGGSSDLLLSDLYQTTWFATVNFLMVPFYGKMSFAAEFDPAYDLFLLVGAGGNGLRVLQSNGVYATSVGAMFNFGIGFRFYVTRLVALRLELRDYFFPEAGTCEACSGVTNSLHFQGGLQFAFGGE
jgi:outer membrane beta-barrel protein